MNDSFGTDNFEMASSANPIMEMSFGILYPKFLATFMAIVPEVLSAEIIASILGFCLMNKFIIS